MLLRSTEGTIVNLRMTYGEVAGCSVTARTSELFLSLARSFPHNCLACIGMFSHQFSDHRNPPWKEAIAVIRLEAIALRLEAITITLFFKFNYVLFNIYS